ncbi:flavin reductase family protein [Variovorax sp. CCNWLW225]|nr:flavin reductase family protein [Variovorax beijingensis]
MPQSPPSHAFHGLDCRALNPSQQAKLITSAIVPRPIALICTKGPAGLNAAPFSFFNIASINPMMVMFSIAPTQYQRAGEPKDTLVNIEASREFVAHLVDYENREGMNACGPEYPADVSELEVAQFTLEPSVKVQTPRIVNFPIQFECVLSQMHDLGGSGHRLVVGEVVYAHYREGVFNEQLHVNLGALDTIGRLSSPGTYARITDRFQMLPPTLSAAELKPSAMNS